MIKQKYPLVFIPGLIVGHKLYEHWKVKKYVDKQIPMFYIHKRERGLDLIERAEWLVRILDSTFDGQKVHLFGHSAGGLDARLALHLRPDLADNVVSLTTCGTPHHGTPIADNYLRTLEKTKLDEMIFGNDKTELIAKQFTATFLDDFNDKVKTIDQLGTKVYCLPCYIDHKWKAGWSNWRGYDQLSKISNGLNDGTVSWASQTYGEKIGEVMADHKSATLPFRYGFSRNKYQETWDKVIKHILKVEETR